MNPLPADRGHVRTEHAHEASGNFDELSVLSACRLMAEDHMEAVRAVTDAVGAIATWIEAVAARARQGGRLVYFGAGTSGRLGVLDASECPPTFQSDPGQVIGIIAGGDAALRVSSEGREDDPRGAEADFNRINIGELDAVLGIAAGGTTPYVLGGIGLAKSRGALTGLLTCAPRERFAGCDHLIVLNTGPEILTGSTRLKAGSATKLALNMMSTIVFTQLGKVHGNLMVDLRATNQKLLDRAIRVVQALCPDLDRSDAAEILARAEGHVKAAVVMHRLRINLDEARLRLTATSGGLRPIIDPRAQSVPREG